MQLVPGGIPCEREFTGRFAQCHPAQKQDDELRLGGRNTGEIAKYGADERTRTADLLITSELLYQLSYVGLDCRGGVGRRAFRDRLRKR